MDILYLGSKSKPRQRLLDLAEIRYHVIPHKSDECGIDISNNFKKYVLAIAQQKMESLILPAPKELSQNKNTIFVLTADTLIKTTKTEKIIGKPKDLEDAKKMHKIFCEEPIDVLTACCLEKKVFSKVWETTEKEHFVVETTIEFCVQENEFDWYIKKLPHALHSCGAGIIEDFGLNFLKKIKGSFTSVMGLPLFELRTALKKIGFEK